MASLDNISRLPLLDPNTVEEAQMSLAALAGASAALGEGKLPCASFSLNSLIPQSLTI